MSRRELPAQRSPWADAITRASLPRSLPLVVAAAALAAQRRWRPFRRYRRGFRRGFGIGLLLGILYAPRAGRESRALLRTGMRWGGRVYRALRWLRAR